MARTFINNKWQSGLPVHEKPHDSSEITEDNKPGGYFWQRAAVSAPLIAGVGVGIHRLIGRDIFPRINFPRNNFLDKFRANIQSFAGDASERVSELRARQETADPSLIKAAWEQALQSADPGKIIRRVQLDNEDPLNTIEYFSKTNKSFQANKVIKNFIGQFKALEQHAIATFANPTDIKFFGIKTPKFTRRELGINQLDDPMLQESLRNIEKQISTVPEASMKLYMTERPGMVGSQLMVNFSGGKFGQTGTSLELPMELKWKKTLKKSGKEIERVQPGIIIHGTNQQTKRIVGRYFLVDKTTNTITSTLKHEQYAARLFEQELLPKLLSDNVKNSYQLHRMVNEFNRKTIENGIWVNNIPAGRITGHDARIEFGASVVNLIDQSNFSRLDSEATGVILANTANKLYPSTSGNQLSKGIVSSINAQNYWLSGRVFPWERQPMQALRRGYGPTQRSRAARLADEVRNQYRWMRTDEFHEAFDPAAGIQLKTIYVSEKQYPKFGEKVFGGTAGGHSIVSKEVEDQFEHYDPLQIKLSKVSETVKKQMDISQTHPGIYDFRFPLNLTEGEIVGYDNMGQPIHFNNNMKIMGARLHSDNDEDFIKLFGTRITNPEHPKVFGSDKAVASMTSQKYIDRLLKSDTNLAFEGARYLTNIDVLKKNRALHNTQMLTALHEFTLQNMQTKGKALNIVDFDTVANSILDSGKEGIIFNNDNIVKNVLLEARKQEFSSHQMGLTFGALPEVYGDEWRTVLGEKGIKFSNDETARIQSGHAFGVSQLFYGGVPTSGGLGSVEPRFFEMLKGPQYGTLGNKVIQDIAQRQIISNPEIVMEQSILEQSLKSISSGTKKMEGVTDYHIKDMKPSIIEEILQKGGRVDLGGALDNMSHLYIPGTEKSKFMRGFTTPEGEIVSADLKYAFHDVLETASDVFHKTGKRKEAEDAMQKLVAELGAMHAKTITGKGMGLARSKVMGSLYATVLPGTAGELGDLYTVGVSKSDAMSMIDQMSRMYHYSNLSDKKTKILELEDRRKRLLEGGIVGIIGSRDPDIGPYSIGAGKMKILPGLSHGYIKAPQATKIIRDAEGNEIGRAAVGFMAGKAGDYDEDNVHIMLSSSDIEKDIAGHYQLGNPLLQAENEYVIRQQMLKAKAPPSEGLTLGEDMLAGAEKLALSKEKVGPISTPFREIRAALTQANLPLKEHLPAMSLLEALEQVPISGKHVPAEKIQLLREQLTRLGGAASRGKGFELADIAHEVLGANQLLTDDQKVYVDDKEMILPSLNVDKSAETINRVMLDFKGKSAGKGSLSEASQRAIMSGKRLLEGNQIESHLAYEGGLLSEFKLASKGIGSMISRTRTAVQNSVTAIGGEIMEHAGKPLAIGFGASLAIAAALSKPISNLAPGASAPMTTGKIASANTSHIKPETIHPDSQITGQPTIPPSIPPPTARITDESRPHISIRGINRNNASMSALSNAISQRLGTSSSININIRDRKTSLSQQKIDQITRR